MKCPMCGEELDIPDQVMGDCMCISKKYSKEIYRLRNLIKRFMKAIGKPVRSWMLGNPELMKELLEEVDKP